MYSKAYSIYLNYSDLLDFLVKIPTFRRIAFTIVTRTVIDNIYEFKITTITTKN